MKLGIILVFVSAAIYFGGYFLYLYYSEGKVTDVFNGDNWVNPLNAEGITDYAELYKNDQQTKVDNMYVTVLKAQANVANNDFSFQDLINYRQDDDGSEPSFKVYFEDGMRNLMDNSIFVREANALLELRGKSPGNDIQKSFKITLHDKEGLWHNQKIINLNKHYADPLRIRNKLAFDYFSVIPDISSFRTRFVRLYIKDLSTGSSDAEFEDYGVFTQVEQPNKLFLTNHRLDPNAQLYGAQDFRFLRYPDAIRNKNDSAYSKKEFEKILEIKGNDDHQKLIKMLEAVNDSSTSIDEVIVNYFDKDNYLTWLAANILFDNPEVSFTNFLLYSPLNSTKWYFMPWDFDEAFGLKQKRPTWQKGVSVYWDNVLHRRFLEKPENIKALNNKIDELSDIVNKKQTKRFLDSYYDIIMSNITKLPDIKYLPVTIETYETKYEELPEVVERNRLYYYELQENPMPFLLYGPEQQENRFAFSWEKSLDLQGDDLFYNFEISRSKDFSSIEISFKDLKETKIELDNLGPGSYYWRVVVKDAEGHSQTAANIIRDEFGDKYFGVKQFLVK